MKGISCEMLYRKTGFNMRCLKIEFDIRFSFAIFTSNFFK